MTLEEIRAALTGRRIELTNELAEIDKMLGVNGAKKAGRKKATAKKTSASPRALELVFAALTEKPETTSEIAARVKGLGQSSVGKALGQLKDEGRIRFAGYQPGVKGKRPMFARFEGSTIISDLTPGPQRDHEHVTA